MVGKPSEKEEEYFARMEYERKKKIEEERRQKLGRDEKDRLRELHYMRCPKCGMGLTEIDYRGIKVDRCSGCGGLWFDVGELGAVSKTEKTVFDRFFKGSDN
jgi:uncharacterized protein